MHTDRRVISYRLLNNRGFDRSQKVFGLGRRRLITRQEDYRDTELTSYRGVESGFADWFGIEADILSPRERVRHDSLALPLPRVITDKNNGCKRVIDTLHHHQ